MITKHNMRTLAFVWDRVEIKNISTYTNILHNSINKQKNIHRRIETSFYWLRTDSKRAHDSNVSTFWGRCGGPCKNSPKLAKRFHSKKYCPKSFEDPFQLLRRTPAIQHIGPEATTSVLHCKYAPDTRYCAGLYRRNGMRKCNIFDLFSREAVLVSNSYRKHIRKMAKNREDLDKCFEVVSELVQRVGKVHSKDPLIYSD